MKGGLTTGAAGGTLKLRPAVQNGRVGAADGEVIRMGFETCVARAPAILMEGALGERLRREFGLLADSPVALAALARTEAGRAALRALWTEYRAIAERYRLPFLATTPTRRANRERVEAAGESPSLLAENVALLRQVQREAKCEMYIGGLMGCRGDAYTGEGCLPVEQAHRFHSWQARLLAEAGVEFLMAGIMPTLPEAMGMARAMADTGLPYMVSFTIQGDGRLVDGTAIAVAVDVLDRCATRPPVCYMANCVHPRILHEALSRPINQAGQVRRRFWGLQANASPLPYAQLDGSRERLTSSPQELAQAMAALRRYGLRIFGGCCGTDGSHLREIARSICPR